MKSAVPPSSQSSGSSRSLLDALPPDAGSASAGDALVVGVGGEAVTLFADRALYWPRERTLFVADLHLGKAATFRAHGVPMPRGVTATDLARLTALIARSGATRVVVLGDLLHARAGRVAALDALVEAWRSAHRETAIVLVRGNHDAHAGDPPAAWAIDCRPDPYPMPPFLACHAPASPRSGYALCGHVHPGVRLHGHGEESARLPCFVLGERHAILPAFGRFTGLALVAPSPEQRIVAIAGSTLFPLPRPSSAT
ncbi:MAG: ligase-associated DNA damage response endonuclease PdeM [Casimicrobiaceae bacterium]